MSLFSSPNTEVDNAQSTKVSPLMRSILNIRGGDEDEEADEEEEEDEEEDDDEEEEAAGLDFADILEKALDVTKEVIEVTKVKIFPVVAEYSKIGAVQAKNTSVSLYKAIRRAISAAMEGDDDEDSDDEDDEDGETALDKAIDISKKAIACVKRMVKAAMTVPETEASAEEEDDDEEVADDEAEETAEETKDATEATVEASSDAPEAEDFGAYLAEAYGVADERNSGKKKGVTILGGSLQDALQTAKLEARMLLVMIPAEKPEGERGGWFGGKKGNEESGELDKVAIESLLSQEVSKAANKKSLKKKGDGESGSFAIWLGKSGSSEATSAIKQLKLKETSTKGTKRPIMCVVYPTISAGKIAGQVLAQHHCNPPMKAESMSSWMNTLRKRHAKQYVSMQTDLKEMKLYQERKEGYIDSMQSDKERKLKEAKEEAERKAQEIKEAARQAEIDARRVELAESLPEDVKKGSNVKKIALRFPDGRSGQRGFEADQPLSVVFNWVDAMFEIERETVVLTTLNGKQTFSWDSDDSKTLEEAGLKKMTAFRVTAAAAA